MIQFETNSQANTTRWSLRYSACNMDLSYLHDTKVETSDEADRLASNGSLSCGSGAVI